jgi:tetratricopeptide (TPR) repeat protein/tRNA A-37 threonylcarbamoyl transferase component Bud32
VNPERWRRVDQLLAAVLEREPGQRESFLADACGGDEELRKEVLRLMAAHDAASDFLEMSRPVENRTRSSETQEGSRWLEQTSPTQGGGPDLKRGSTLGRYVVLNKLGGGGMGVVYLAYDPELDRRVALKLLRPEALETLAGEAARSRLLREAQAMARLSHPNVISVHDVGTLGERVFIAMEYVPGWTLTRWLKEKLRSRQEILGVFAQAGKGLGAAHTAGLVHRDFKPENVLIGKSGQVKVLDFGLARAGQDSEDVAPTLPRSFELKGSSTPRALEEKLTRSGAFLGTPAYMAPEQFLGSKADARTDQFSFCVALYEALYGERPFAGDSIEVLIQNVTKGDLRAPSKSSSVPGWLRDILLQGLRIDPDQRFPTMEELLRQLSKDRGALRRRAVVLGGTALLLGVALFGYRQAVNRQQQVCSGAAERLSGVWDDGRKQAVSAAFLATKTPYAADTARAVEKLLNDYTRDWVEMQRDACRATRLRGEQSEAVLDLRTDCLNRRLEEVKALTDLFEKSDAKTVEKAVQAAQSLPSLHACADVLSLSAPIRLPESPAVRQDLKKQEMALAKVQALRDTGRYAEGLALAIPTAQESHRLGYKPLEAEAKLLVGVLEARLSDAKAAEKALHEAAAAAEAGRHDEVKARAWINLVEQIGTKEARTEEGRRLAMHATAILDRLGNPPELSEALQYALGVLSLTEGKYADAMEHLKKALDICEKTFGQDHPRTAHALTRLATAAREHGVYDEAVVYGRRAQQILERAVGPDHPVVADASNVVGSALQMLGKYDEALELQRRVLAIRERVMPETLLVAYALISISSVLRSEGKYADALVQGQRALAIEIKSLGPQDPEVAAMLVNLGNLAYDMGDELLSIDYDRRALAIQEKVLGPEHPKLATTLSNLSSVLCKHGNYQAAMEPGLRALAIREKVLGPEHTYTAVSLDNIGEIYDELKNSTKGLVYHQRALAIHERKLGANHPQVAWDLTSTGRSYILAGKPKAALPLLDRALAIYQGAKGDPLLPAGTKFLKARALWDSGKDKETALQLGREAYDAFVKAGAPRTRPYRELETWLRAKSQGRTQRVSTR